MPGSKNLDSHAGLIQRLKSHHANGKLLGAICAAPMVLGHAGILHGKKAVCYPGFEEHLAGSELVTLPSVVSGNVVTGRGVGAALDFSLRIVELLISPEKARQLAQSMLTHY